MNKKYLLSLLTCLMMVFALASCGSDDKKDDGPDLPPAPTNVVTITNNSTGSFQPLYIVFRNGAGEQLRSDDLGDCHPGDVKTATIPGSANSWFLACFDAQGNLRYTADHLVSETSFSITNAVTWY